MSKAFKLLVSFIFVAVSVAACTPSANTNTTNNNTPTEQQQPTDNTNTEDQTTDFVITMENFSFSQNLIEAEPGDTITIKLISNGGTHDFVLDEFNVKSNLLDSGETETIEITIPEDQASGDFEFYCSFGTHRQMGMVGTLSVK